MKYLNIPSNYNFLESLYRFILEEFENDKLLLSKLIILLPSRRSCNELKRIFLSNKTTTFLPTIKALGDIDYDDIILENIDLGILKKYQEISKPVSNIKYKLLMIKKLGIELKNTNIDYLISISKELNSFLNEVERENLDINKLEEVVDDEYSIHWQKILSILKIFGYSWKKYLDENKLISGTNYGYEILRINTELFKTQKPSRPILIAGNIYSTKITNNFVETLSKYDNTYLVFKGYENILNKKESEEIDIYNFHYFYKNITEKLNIKDVENITYNELKVVDNIDYLYYSMLPSNLTYKWKEKIDCNCDNVSLIECNDDFEELDAITFSLLDYINKNGLKNIAVVTTVDFAKKLEIKFKYWNIPYNNTFGNKLIYSKLIQFLLSIIDTINDKFNPITLLNVLKNNYSLFGFEKNELEENINLFQDNVLFGKVNLNGFNSYYNIINCIEDIETKTKLKLFVDKIKSYFDVNFNNIELNTAIKNHLLLAEKISTNNKINGQDSLWFNDDNVRIFELLQDFIKNSNDFFVKNIREYSSIFKYIISELSYTKEYSSYPSVNLISYSEARLINYDLVILTNMNDGNFPSNIPTDPWMNRNIRKCFGLQERETSFGISSFEFIQLLSQKEVIITRALKENNKPAIESRFLLRLKTFLKCNNYNLKTRNDIINTINEYYKQQEKIKISHPEPKPILSLRPRKLSATNIEKLIKNPYQIYCKYILKLFKKNDINIQNNILVFGNVIHEVFEQYCRNYNDIIGDKFEYIQKLGKEIFEKYYYDSKNTILLLFDRFLESAKIFIEYDEIVRKNKYKVFIEEFGSINIEKMEITAKADRIETKNNIVNIIDYKTGTMPSKMNILNGINLQLLIEALIIKNCGFKNIDAKDVDLIKYLSTKDGKEAIINNDKNNELDELIKKTENFIKYLIEYFNNEENAYIPTGKDNDKNDYLHLSRFDEWIYN